MTEKSSQCASQRIAFKGETPDHCLDLMLEVCPADYDAANLPVVGGWQAIARLVVDFLEARLHWSVSLRQKGRRPKPTNLSAI